MNSGTIKGLIGLVAGVIFGGALAYKIQRERWEDKYYETVEEIKEDYIRGEGDFKEEVETEVEDVKTESKVSEEDNVIAEQYIDEYKKRYGNDTNSERDENDPYSSITLTRFRAAMEKKRAMKQDRENRGIKSRPYVDHPYYISEEEYYQMCESVFDYRGYELYFDDETRDVYNVDGTIFAEQSDAWVHLGKGMLDVLNDEAPDPLYIQNDDLKEVYMLFKSRGSSMNEHRHTAGPPSDSVWNRYEFDDLEEE